MSLTKRRVPQWQQRKKPLRRNPQKKPKRRKDNRAFFPVYAKAPGKPGAFDFLRAPAKANLISVPRVVLFFSFVLSLYLEKSKKERVLFRNFSFTNS
jgi:hypothetical protein